MQMFAVIQELWETQCGPEARPAASCIPSSSAVPSMLSGMRAFMRTQTQTLLGAKQEWC